MCAILDVFKIMEIGHTIGDIIIAIYFFPRWRPFAILDFWHKFGDLVVFITVQNLSGIASVSLIIQKFEYFAC